MTLEDTAQYQEHVLKTIDWPSVVLLEPSSRCNLHCPMCPRTVGLSPSGAEHDNMSLELLTHLEAPLRHAHSVILAWIGEPLINKDLPGFVQRLKAYHLHVHVTSNGMLLKSAAAKALIAAGLDSLALSIDAADPEIYRQIRVGGDLEIVKANVQELQRLKQELASQTPSLEVAFVAMEQNIHELPRMIGLLEELGIDRLSITPVDDFGLPANSLTHESGAFGSKAEARALVQEAQQLAQAKHIGIVYNALYRLRWEIGEIPLAEGPQLRSDYTAADLRRLGMRKACGVPWAHVVIGDNGDVHPCCASDRVMGNVTRQPFEEIWFGQPYDDFRRRMLSTDPPPECLRCQRAAWQPLQKLSDLRSSLVHRHEVHGQGWGEEFLASDGVWYRHMGKSSTFFLRYRREAFLHMKLGTFTPEPIVGQVIVNDVVVGDFHVQEQQQHVTCRLPRLKGPVIRVTLTGQPADYKLVMYESVLSRLGQPWYRRFSPSVKWNLLKPRG